MTEIKLEDTIEVAGTTDVAGEATDADSTPTLTVFKNGSAIALLTDQNMSHGGTGEYYWSHVIGASGANGGFSAGDRIRITATAVVDGVTSKATLLQGRIVSARASDAVADIATANASLTTLLSRLSSARAGYLDNLNVGGAVASQADVNALNQSASRRLILTTVDVYERPESGTKSLQIEARTYTADGDPVNADSTPTLTATGIVSGSLSANLSAGANPSTGVYRWTYTVSSTDTLEQVRFDLSATISSAAQVISAYTQVADFVAATFTTADRAMITAAYNKLPSTNYLAGAAASDGKPAVINGTGTGEVPTAAQNAAAVATQITSDHGSGSYARNTEPLTASQTRDALGLAEANLDDQLELLATASDLDAAAGTIDQIEEDTRLMRSVIAGVRSAADNELTTKDRDGTTNYARLTQGTTPGEITDVEVLI